MRQWSKWWRPALCWRKGLLLRLQRLLLLRLARPLPRLPRRKWRSIAFPRRTRLAYSGQPCVFGSALSPKSMIWGPEPAPECYTVAQLLREYGPLKRGFYLGTGDRGANDAGFVGSGGTGAGGVGRGTGRWYVGQSAGRSAAARSLAVAAGGLCEVWIGSACLELRTAAGMAQAAWALSALQRAPAAPFYLGGPGRARSALAYVGEGCERRLGASSVGALCSVWGCVAGSPADFCD